MAEYDMVEIMHDEHQEMGVGLAMGLDELLVQKQFGRLLACHARRLDLVRETHPKEREEGKHLERPRRQQIEDAGDDGLRSHDC